MCGARHADARPLHDSGLVRRGACYCSLCVHVHERIVSYRSVLYADAREVIHGEGVPALHHYDYHFAITKIVIAAATIMPVPISSCPLYTLYFIFCSYILVSACNHPSHLPQARSAETSICYTIKYYTILCYAILYCTVLHYTIPQARSAETALRNVRGHSVVN